MLRDNMLDDLYQTGLGFSQLRAYLSRMLQQITHRYPHAKVVEIGMSRCTYGHKTPITLTTNNQVLELGIRRRRSWTL